MDTVTAAPNRGIERWGGLGAILYVVARVLSVGVAWGIVLGMFCAVFCFIANAIALFFVVLADFFQTF